MALVRSITPVTDVSLEHPENMYSEFVISPPERLRDTLFNDEQLKNISFTVVAFGALPIVAEFSIPHPLNKLSNEMALGSEPIVAVSNAEQPEKTDEAICADARSGSETLVRAEQPLAKADTLDAFSMPRTSGSFFRNGFRAKQ